MNLMVQTDERSAIGSDKGQYGILYLLILHFPKYKEHNLIEGYGDHQ
jgi:hypothetical protein